MENDLRRWMRLVENESETYFHGSNASLAPGTVLRTSGKATQDHFYHREKFLEQLRPKDKLSRFACIFMVSNPRYLGDALGYEPRNVYPVQPTGRIERSNLSWFDALYPIDDMEDEARAWIGDHKDYDYLVTYAKNYWAGVVSDGPWEYRTEAATIIGDDDEED